MPLVGGELARAAFEHGFERLRRGHPPPLPRADRPRGARPTSGTSPTADRPAWRPAPAPRPSRPTAGGRARCSTPSSRASPASRTARSASSSVRLAPRWAAADADEAEVSIGYAASGARIGYRYERRRGTIRLDVEAPASEVAVHLLLPDGARAERVRCGTREVRLPSGDDREEPLRGLRRRGRRVLRDPAGGDPR